MTQPSAVTVPPSVFRLSAGLVVGNLGVAGGLLLILGPGRSLEVVCATAVGLSAVLFLVAVVRQEPRLVITHEGFALYRLFGARSYKWTDIDGQFAVIKIGWSKAVAYNLTADYKARVGKKRTSVFAGYDDAIPGAFRLSASELAELLNDHKQRSPSSASAGATEVQDARPLDTAGPCGHAEAARMLDPFAEVGKWLRVLSGLVMAAFAILFAVPAVVLPFAVVVLSLQGELQIVAILSMSLPVYATLAMVFFWLARRLLRGTRSPGSVTIIPLWFIQLIGVLMLVGLFFHLYQAHFARDPSVPALSALFYVASFAVSAIMVFAPWLARQRLRRSVARESGNCESQPKVRD